MRKGYVFGGVASAAAIVLAVVTFEMLDPAQRAQMVALRSPAPEDAAKPGGPMLNEAEKGTARGKDETAAGRKADDKGARARRDGQLAKTARSDLDRPAESRESRAAPPASRPRAEEQNRAVPAMARRVSQSAAAPVEPRGPAAAPAGAGAPASALVGGLADRMSATEATRFRREFRSKEAVQGHYEAVGRDRFTHVEENAVRRVADAPVSTFSIDVDTASYAFVRRMLNRGTLPQKDAVRIEELINYFDYDYPLAETREQPFAPSVAVIPSPWKEGNKLIRIGIRGYDIAPAEKPRSNLVFLLDVSGSMNRPDKLPLMVSSMKLLLETLKPDDTVAIVVYAGAAGTVLEPTRVAEKHRILAALDRLRAGGSTAGAAGIRQAYALAEGSLDSAAVNRVILATDGDFNVGITSRDELKGFVERKRATGVYLSVLGFGQGNLNDRLMQTLAQNGNGVAAYIDTLGEARKVLVQEASSTLFPIARDVKIQVEFNPKTVAEYRLIGYETRALKREDFNNDKVDAGDIGAGHKVTALYEITPAAGGAPMIGASRYQGNAAANTAPPSDFADEYAFLKIRYKLPKEGVSRLISRPITTADERGEDAGDARRETGWAAAVAGFGQILKGGKYTGAFTFDDVIALARQAKGPDEYGYRAEFINLVRLARSASALPNR